jgi:hypothetical protein
VAVPPVEVPLGELPPVEVPPLVLVPELPWLVGAEQPPVASLQQVPLSQVRPRAHDAVASHGHPCAPSTQKPDPVPLVPPLAFEPPLGPLAPEPWVPEPSVLLPEHATARTVTRTAGNLELIHILTDLSK